MKVKIHNPRKDLCDLCIAHDLGHVNENEYTAHTQRKNNARALKNQLIANSDKTTLIFSMDLQSILLCSKTKASCMYYKQKLQVHNFTIKEENSNHVELYVWHEASGGVSSNEYIMHHRLFAKERKRFRDNCHDQ